VATMLTPGRGMLPAFTVPWTEPPATEADAGGGGLLGAALGAALEGGFTAGAAAGRDCAPAGVMREPLNKQKSREMRRIKMNFLLLPTQLRPSSFQHVVRIARPEGIGRVPQVRQSVPGTKTTGRSPHERIGKSGLDRKGTQPISRPIETLSPCRGNGVTGPAPRHQAVGHGHAPFQGP
jgi:hypothetical protein